MTPILLSNRHQIPVADAESFLVERGWNRVANSNFPHWCWQQPKTKALFCLSQAYDVEISRKNKKRGAR